MKIRIDVAYNKYTGKLYLKSDGLVSTEFGVERLSENLQQFRRIIRTHLMNLQPRESKPVAIEIFINGEVV